MSDLHKTDEYDTDALFSTTETHYVALTRFSESVSKGILDLLKRIKENTDGSNQQIKQSVTLSIMRNVRFSDEGLNQKIAILSVGFDHHENFFLKVTKLNNGIYEVHDKDYSFASVQFTAEEVEMINQELNNA